MTVLSALDRAMVTLAAHLLSCGAKQEGLHVSSADGRLVVETDAEVSVPGVFAGFTVIRRDVPGT